MPAAMLQQPRVPPTGQRQAVEIQIKWREVLAQKQAMLKILSQTTGHSPEKLDKVGQESPVMEVMQARSGIHMLVGSYSHWQMPHAAQPLLMTQVGVALFAHNATLSAHTFMQTPHGWPEGDESTSLFHLVCVTCFSPLPEEKRGHSGLIALCLFTGHAKTLVHAAQRCNRIRCH